MKFSTLSVEQLEDRCTPVVHSFSAATGVSDSPNAGGSPQANIVVAVAHGVPAPVVVGGLHAQGVPFIANHVPASPVGSN